MFDLSQVRTDAQHRSKIIETFWLFWAFLLIGFDNGILGPCLPDLQASVGATLDEMSYVFFVQGTGALLGNVLGFLLERRYDRRALMAAYILVGSAVNVVIPLVPSLVYLLAMFLVQGVTKGLADFGAMSLCNILWETDKALPFQFIVVGAGISTFVSPMMAQPFIDESLPALPKTGAALSAEQCPGKQPLVGVHHHDSFHHHQQQHHLFDNNGTGGFLPHSHDDGFFRNGMLSGGSASGGAAGGGGAYTWQNTAIRWPFLIVGCVSVPAAVAFIYYYLAKRKEAAEEDSSLSMEISVPAPGKPSDRLLKDGGGGTETRKRTSHQPRTVLLFRVLIIVLNFPVFGLLLTFADLLTSVGMTSPLCLNAVEASRLNTVLWGAAMIGRAVSALILICVPMFTQLLLCAVGLVGAGAVLVARNPADLLSLWFGTAGVGLFATPAMPGFIAWSGDYAPVTPFFMNLSLCAAGVGEMLLPFVGGQLMAAYGTLALMGFNLAVMAAMLLLLGLSYYVATFIDR